VLVSPEVPKSWLVTRLPAQLAAALDEHNASCSANARIRLRMALHAGEIHPDAHGVTGSAVNRTFRLVEAPVLKAALGGSAGVLALIVSDWFYDEVVRHEPAADPGCYRPVHAVVKETQAAAWMRILDPPAGKDNGQAGSSAGGYPRRRAHAVAERRV
jgi:class 3 adenylate cyclase